MTDFSVSGLSEVIHQLLPEPHAGLLLGLLFGTKASLSREFYQALVITGTLHIIALSGMNISIIMDMIAKSLQWSVGRRGASLISIAAVLWFVWFVGSSATIVRAAIMGSVSLLSVIFGRQYWALLSWTLAVGIMLLLNFSWIGDISFQLSAMATLGIILFGRSGAEVGTRVSASPSSAGLRVAGVGGPPGRGPLVGIPGGKPQTGPDSSFLRVALLENVHLPAPFGSLWTMVKDNIHLTLAAQVFTIPLILFHFHRISFISPLANLAIGWVVAPLTILGWVTAFAGWVFFPLGQAFAWIAWMLLEYMIRVIYTVSTVPFASLGW